MKCLTVKKIVIIGIVVAIGAALYGWFFIYNKPHTDYEKVSPDFVFQAEKLFNEYTNGNGTPYTGKVIEIEGQAVSLDDADTLTTLIFVFREGDFGEEGIRCTFKPKFNDHLRKKQLPAPIRLKGFCAGYNGTDVVLEHCSLLK